MALPASRSTSWRCGVKVFLAVNPSNPTAVGMDAQAVERIGAIVRDGQS